MLDVYMYLFCYHGIIFNNNLIVANAGDLSHSTRPQYEKVASLLKDMGIIVVLIPENWD